MSAKIAKFARRGKNVRSKYKSGPLCAFDFRKPIDNIMKSYKENGKNVVEIEDLSFISDRGHKLGWFGLHFTHFRIKYALSRADSVVVPTEDVAWDVFRYYFFPKERIFVTSIGLPYSESSHKA